MWRPYCSWRSALPTIAVDLPKFEVFGMDRVTTLFVTEQGELPQATLAIGLEKLP